MKLYKAYAKVNVFLKVTGMRDNYHEIISRFMRVDSLYDELSFVPKEESEFKIYGNFSCQTNQNTIYKAYFALKQATGSESLEKLMRSHGVDVKKSIPAFAGLGGGSSDAATYLKMCNEVLHLGLSLNDLARIGLKVGADVPFFIYGYKSANVSGIGEIVEEFDEESLDFEVFTPDIQISTPKVYQIYRDDFYAPIDGFKTDKLKKMSSKEILKSMRADEANDLFKPALQAYKDLKKHYQHGWHFSGSGSSFFRVKEK
ncbi:MAG: 4-(cytidine 5'-diphospho)-2-C-methyl-D-erythritol kinase [Epsilonproteobacteria bacterium]|nr:4-(cytidine 5'-diphospho)-2-C-methyl-D-erythritol kinase [Campylobacterota bacterium]OIO17142.1 MAG: 4-(cytidine 5'-diphospho)-2-C-methyl-D-erythritol kinase [Helicobacteraceae bacterium CG1_02_36_14]PIP10113.1 MAG: 4-(cytidine 5'-diphospho)-2-C-methyl-D-erythritol kinase [Sulfurimonas sp. CG23_combo_of_CG06-09_8_20_14_all_36_33]PIS26568.1 MAG: 4-(cytidine 5'-diphospho)-2-C-methyl-D-erythritol kinase [Sulfurimonas sp. CG08_land_8_20_14_0_20_36_33]PIU34029.1 MAG: 4-(cytidine 5'-diphospho)-2-C